MSEEPRKRSRFDKGPDDEPPRKSRFDRRSRSPSTTDHGGATRDRSPLKSPAASDAAAKAAEAAARINAQLQSKKGIQHVDVPPIRAPSAGPGAAKSPSAPATSGTLNDEIYQQDGDFIKDIEVNDLRNRYTLTKGSTQKMIKEETGADVTTRGNYYPDKSMATAANPPLYLHVTSTTKDGLEKAVAKIEELMKQELPNLIDERRFRKTREERDPNVELDHKGRRKWPEKRIPIDLEPIPGFNLRAQVVGSGGSYVKHIQQETRCRVQIKGRGSGFMEHETGRESDEQMYLHVAGPEQAMVDAAEEQCNSLLDSVRQAYENYKDSGPRSRGPPGGGGGGGFNRQYSGDQGGGYGGHGDRQGSASYDPTAYNGGGSAYGGGYGQQAYAQQAYGAGGAQSPTAAAGQTQPAMDPAEQMKQWEAWAAYYAQNPSIDPYAAYGGFAAVMQNYMPGGAQQGQQPQGYGAQAMMGNGGAPPPPPPDDNQPPPPPPGAGNGYSAVPPPPGM